MGWIEISKNKCRACDSSMRFCKCPIADLRLGMNPVMDSYIKMYSEIALRDLEISFQPHDQVQEKSNLDFERIKWLIGKFFPATEPGKIRILEIGPGLGQLGQALRKEGFDYWATDIVDHYLINFLPNAFLSNLENLPEFTHPFHIVVVCDVLEHVLNEGSAIISIFRALSDNGVVYARSPYLEPSINYANQLGAPYPFVHVRTYSKKSMKLLMASAGFRVKKIRRFKPVVMSHTRRSFGAQMSQFSRLRSDFEGAYAVQTKYPSVKITSLDSTFHNLFKRLEKRYLERISAHKIERKIDILTRHVLYRAAELYCVARKDIKAK